MKFYGKVGFRDTVETAPGVWTEQIISRYYYGDFMRYSSRNQSAQKVNDDIALTNQLSIVADEYAYSNFYSMIYVECMGCKWKVTSVEVQHPRLIITFGGVWNE